MAQKPKRRHPQPPIQRGPGLEEILSRARALQEEGKLEEALQVLDEAPPHLQRRSELLLLRGLLQAGLDQMEEALGTLEEAQRRDPDNLLTYFFLGLLYTDLDLHAHARRALREVMEYRDMFTEDMVREAQDTLDGLEKILSASARELGLSLEQMEEAQYQLELGLRAFYEDDFPTALRHIRRAASIAPRWRTPREMEAETLMLSGRPREAVEVAKRLLDEDPDLVPIREVLVRAYLALGNREAAEEVVRPLRTRSYQSTLELEQAVKALGYLNDDEGIYRLYRRHLQLVHEMEDTNALTVMGSAAANLGHFHTARWLWEEAVGLGAPARYLEEFIWAASRKAPGPGIAERYPTFQFAQFAPAQASREFQELLAAWLESEVDRKSLQKRLRALVARHPVLLQQVIQLFRELSERSLPMGILAAIGTPEALEELRRFAFGQKERLSERMVALQRLADAGGIDPGQPVEVWDDARQEWRQVKVPGWKIIEPDPIHYPRPVLEIVRECQEAVKAGETGRAQQLTEKALSIAPGNPDLYVLLALIWSKDQAKSEEYLQKAMALNPRHVGARVRLARLALARHDVPTARQHIEAIGDQREFVLQDFLEYLFVMAMLSLEEEDFAMARFYTDVGLNWGPEDDKRFTNLDWIVDLRYPGSPLQLLQERSIQYRERKRTRPIRPDASLRECLERLGRESLVAVARVHGVRYVKLRKEALLQRLVEALTDPATLERAVSSLSDTERQALRDVLDAGGILPWDEFTARYGSDVEEGQYWSYSEPKTLMGRLRMYGFLSDGTVEGQRVVLIPGELRDRLPGMLASTEARDEQP